ncbi:class I SAM-dependent methyltransferase [Candidatus Korobacter versatilis]|nr:class I SAM-dependent methyltransferase [Candidatus Koribacter versatilis]
MAPGFFSKFFGGGEKNAAGEPVSSKDRIQRRSTGFQEFMKTIGREENIWVLDLGPTSPSNIKIITERGHRIYNEDVLKEANGAELKTKSIDPCKEGQTVVDVTRYLAENLKHDREKFDAVMAWDIPDYLPEEVVKPTIERIHTIMKPGGMLLAFFHTKDAGPDAPYFRYHIADAQTLELQKGPQFRLQRVFNNRHIENLFRDYASIKFFLGRDNIREVLVIR